MPTELLPDFGLEAAGSLPDFGSDELPDFSTSQEAVQPEFKPNPYDTLKYQQLQDSSQNSEFGSSDFIAAVAQGPVGFAKSIPGAVLSAAAFPGKLAYNAAADVISKMGEDDPYAKEYGGNLAAMSSGEARTPAEKFIAGAAKTNPNLAVAANVAKSLPELASMMAVNPSGTAGKLLAAGFSLSSIKSFGDTLDAYNEEADKPEDKQNPGRIAELRAGLIESPAFALLAGYGSVKGIGPKVQMPSGVKIESKTGTPTVYRRPGEGPPTYPIAGERPAPKEPIEQPIGKAPPPIVAAVPLPQQRDVIAEGMAEAEAARLKNKREVEIADAEVAARLGNMAQGTLPVAPVKYEGMQAGPEGMVQQWTVTEDVPGLQKNSTYRPETITAAGYSLPEIPKDWKPPERVAFAPPKPETSNVQPTPTALQEKEKQVATLPAPAETLPVAETPKAGATVEAKAAFPVVEQAAGKRVVKRARIGDLESQGKRGYDLIDAAKDTVGKKISWRLIKEANPDWKPTGAARDIFAANGIPADVAAQALKESGHYKGDPAMVDQFGEAMNRTASARKGNRIGQATDKQILAKEEAQTIKFQDDIKKKTKGTETVVPDDLNEGDVFTLKGNKLKVTKLEYDQDGNIISLTLDDGNTYGTQTIDGTTALKADKGSLVSKPSLEFAPEEPLTLEKPESIAEQAARMEKEQALTKARSDKEKLIELQSKPLVGSRGDIGQMDMLGGGDLLSQNSPPPAAGEMKGMGGALAVEKPATAQLAQLTDALRTLAQTQPKPELRRAYSLSEKTSQWKNRANAALDGLKGVAAYAKERLIGMPKWDSFKNALGRRQLALTESALNSRDFVDKALRGIPKALDREAISNWIDAGGDEALLRQGAAETKGIYKAGYERALKLTPEQVTTAKNIQNYFESRLKDAQDAGILENGIEDYIHRIYEKDTPWKQGVLAELRSGVFTGKPALARQRVFQYDFEAEKAGYRPVKDFAKRVAAYDLSLNKAIADRQFIKEAMQWKMKDGRPAIDSAGVGIPIEGKEGDAGPLLIKPQFRINDLENPKNNRSDYVALDHPALRKWKWVGEGKDGQPVMIQGNVLVHPEALGQIKAVFGKSRVRQNPVGRAALALSSTVKQTMLDLSGFHPVQITVHGWEHRTFKPVDKIDLQDPFQRALVSHGLVAADSRGLELFGEGLVGSSLTRHIPGIGPKLQAYNEWLFQDYIPRLKMAMAIHALERNRTRFEKDLASGKMSEDQLLHLTANQGNAAFGELNYEMMGRNKTMQDILRIVLLAPDFLEARGKFAAQAGTKYGSEQRTALILGAATLYVTARIVNKLLDGQYHFELRNAFSIVHNGRAFSLRTVQGDLLHAITDPAKFAFNRLNPLYGRTGLEALTGRDAFGRTRSGLEQIQDIGKTIVPISLRGLLNPKEQKLWESFLNAMGITERRETATDEIYTLARDFKAKNNITEPGEFIYDREKDPYRGLKLSLAYGTPETAAQEILVLMREKGMIFEKVRTYLDQFAKRPFTGSYANDKKFIAGLSEDQKKTYNEALAERKKMREKIAPALSIVRRNMYAQ